MKWYQGVALFLCNYCTGFNHKPLEDREQKLRRIVALGAAYRTLAARVDITAAEWWASRNAFYQELSDLAHSLGMHEEAKRLVREDDG